jgi:NTE family protein
VAFHGAVMAALQNATGWDPRTADVIVGTSAGSITGAMLRAGIPAADLARISEGEPLSPEAERLAGVGRPHRPRPHASDLLRFRPVADPLGVAHGFTHPFSHSRAAMVAAALPAGGIPTEAISTGINAVFGGAWPTESLWLCAVDLRSGRRVVFGRPGAPRTQVGTAVAAASAIPAYFQPVTIAGRRYVDGGVNSMVNLDLMSGLDLDAVIVSSPLSHALAQPQLRVDSIIRQPLRAQLHAELGALRRTGVPVFAIEPGRRVALSMGLNPMDARRRGLVSRATRAAVEVWLATKIEGHRLSFVLRSAAAAGAGAAVGSAGPRPLLVRRPSA